MVVLHCTRPWPRGWSAEVEANEVSQLITEEEELLLVCFNLTAGTQLLPDGMVGTSEHNFACGLEMGRKGGDSGFNNRWVCNVWCMSGELDMEQSLLYWALYKWAVELSANVASGSEESGNIHCRRYNYKSFKLTLLFSLLFVTIHVIKKTYT